MVHESSKQTIYIIGAGAFGCALASCALDRGHRLVLVSRSDKHFQEFKKINPDLEQCHFYLFDEVDFSFNEGAVIFMAVPCQALRDVSRWIQSKTTGHLTIVNTAKGIEESTLLLPHAILENFWQEGAHVATMSGPSFAREMILKKPTAVVAASRDLSISKYIADLLHSPSFRVYHSQDVVGVGLGGALKNVVAVAAGISDGLNFGYNTRAAIISRGLEEIAGIGLKLGANPTTFLGLSGVGDMCLTCTGDLSRNRQLGFKLAMGGSIDEIKRQIGSTIESLSTIHSAYALASQLNVKTPLISFVHDIVHRDRPVEEAFQSFIDRPQTSEFSWPTPL